VPDFKEVLIRAGLAKLRNPDIALEKYRNAQEAAKNEQKGLWSARLAPQEGTQSLTPQPTVTAATSPTPPIATPEPTPILPQPEQAPSAIWNILIILSTLGITGITATIIVGLIKMFWYKRPVRLLIFGELSAGKTAIRKRLLDPNIDRAELEALKPSQSVELHKKRIGIPKGAYEIYPQIVDIPGSFYGSVWDSLLQFHFIPQLVWDLLVALHLVAPRVWLFVVAPTSAKENNGNQMNIDKEYVSVQLGIVKTQVLGGLDAIKTIKPKAVILFINKFDLYSSVRPGDSASLKMESDFKGIFSKHIEVIKTATSRKGVRFYSLAGSAFNSWSCKDIIDRIGHTLYDS
jgi:hypothetical protein